MHLDDGRIRVTKTDCLAVVGKYCFDFWWTKHVTGAKTVWCCCVNKILWG